MGFKDVQQYLAPHLELPLAGKTYLVPPPSKDDGLLLAAFIALGVNAQNGRKSTDEDLALIKKREGADLAEVAFTPAVYQQMVEDGVPGAHIDQAAIYAMYYWTMGEQSADYVFANLYTEAAEGTLPKGLRTLKTGRNTALANQTRTASTRGTASRREPQDRKRPSAKKAASRGDEH